MSVATVPHPGIETREMRARPTRARARVGGLLACAAVLALLCFLSLAIGARSVPLATVWQALTNYDPTSTDQIVVVELRVPRTILGLLVGAARWPIQASSE
jgi:iron complex transport system permease protein